MTLWRCSVAVVLAAIVSVGADLQWTSVDFTDGINFTVCNGSDAIFPWNYRLADGDTVLDAEYYFKPEVGDEELIGTAVGESFLGGLDNVVKYDGTKGIIVHNVNLTNVGTYTMIVNVRTSNGMSTPKQTAILNVNAPPRVQNDKLVVKVLNPSKGGNSSTMHVQLSCGNFLDLGNPPVNESSVVWMTPKGQVDSDRHDDSTFFLEQSNFKPGDEYTCSVKDVPDECNTSDLPGNGTYTVREDSVKLSEVELQVQRLEASMNGNLTSILQRLEHLEQECQCSPPA